MRLASFALIAAAASFAAPARADDIAPPLGGCHYEIALLDAEAKMLEVAMTCEGNGPHLIATYRHITDEHVQDLRALAGSTLEKGAAAAGARAWVLTGTNGIARATHRFDVNEMAESTNSPSIGQRVGGSVVASVRSFLLIPAVGARPRDLTLRFAVPQGAAAETGLAREGERLKFDTSDLPYIGFMAMGRIRTLAVPVKARGGEGVLRVAVLDGPLKPSDDELLHWIGASAARVGAYFGGFPVARSLIVLEPVPGTRYLRRGMVAGGAGATMLLRIGALTESGDLFGQWMLMHELVHFGAPFIDDHAWLMEGMAVYTETRLRVAAGWFPQDLAWRGFLRNFRQGIPAMEQQGLARSRSIGPTYWGGTLFMLLADAEIIEKSQGEKSLADCFRAVLAEGGDTSQRWSLEHFVAVCDGATGFGTFRKLTEAHARKGTKLDLAPLLDKLGVQLGEYEAGVKYDDKAPLAWVRKKIMEGPPAAR